MGRFGGTGATPATRTSLTFETIAWPVCAALAAATLRGARPERIGPARVRVVNAAGGRASWARLGAGEGVAGESTAAAEMVRTLTPLAAALADLGPRRATMYLRAAADRLVICAWEQLPARDPASRLERANRSLAGVDPRLVGAPRRLTPARPGGAVPQRRVCCLSHRTGAGRCAGCPRHG